MADHLSETEVESVGGKWVNCFITALQNPCPFNHSPLTAVITNDHPFSPDLSE
jgi:hypothetical protein